MMNLKNMTNQELSDLEEKIHKEKIFRFGRERREAWGNLCVQIQNYLDNFGDVIIYDETDSIRITGTSMKSPQVGEIQIN